MFLFCEFRNASEVDMMQSYGFSKAECNLWAFNGKGQFSVSLVFE